MAQTSYILLNPTEEVLFFKHLQSGDRFGSARIVHKTAPFSRKKKIGVRSRSFLPAIALLWADLSEAQKTAWSTAGAECGLNGWRLFVQDQSIRILNDLAGVATPSILHQSWVGNLKIESPATEIKIIQLHPRAYWISKKVSGKKGMYEPVEITEDIALPIKISLNYRSNLTNPSGTPLAKFYLVARSSYQGVDRSTTLFVDLDLITDWKFAEATLSVVPGYIIGYELYFHLENLQGDLFVDNIKVEHSGQNWVRDTFCKDINQGFTRAYYQVPKHWVGLIIPAGAEYGSTYPT